MIAIDEAHLYCEWSDFRTAFSDLKNIKFDFPTTPLMALTATATPDVEEELKNTVLRNPVIQKMSMNRPNITLHVEELAANNESANAMQLSAREAEIIQSSSAVIYTDFIADVGKIISSFQSIGISSSYGNHRGRDIGFWRKFLKQCHVLSLVQMELKSLIKSSGYYAVQAVYSPSLNSGQVLNSDDSLMLPIQGTHDNSKSTTGVNAVHKCTRPHDQKKRNGKGSNR